jgi:hypothetical protein
MWEERLLRFFKLGKSYARKYDTPSHNLSWSDKKPFFAHVICERNSDHNRRTRFLRKIDAAQ